MHIVYLTPLQNNNVRFTYLTILNEQILNLISKKLNSTRHSNDGFRMFVFNDNTEILSPVITHICNQSLSRVILLLTYLMQVFHFCMKQETKKNPGNYIAIAISPTFRIFLEKVVEIHLQSQFRF